MNIHSLSGGAAGAASASSKPAAGAAASGAPQGAFASLFSSVLQPTRESAQEPGTAPSEGEESESAGSVQDALLGLFVSPVATALPSPARVEGTTAGSPLPGNAPASAIPGEGTPSDAAAAAAGATPTGDVRAAYRGMDRLHPEFRARFQQVVERMQREFGHRVEVVETHRTQQRQEFLYAQGRTRPGNVVTWTLDSNHKQGRAADVIIDGSYGNPSAYARLARIAAEEGLRTLGPKDAGHVELPRTPGERPWTPPLPQGVEGVRLAGDAVVPAESRPASADGMAQVAQVARVAEVAHVAQVAEVARVATPGRSRSSGAEEAAPAEPRAPEVEARELVATLSSRGTEAPSRAEVVAGVVGSSAAERVARVLALQDNEALRPLSQILLRIDNPAGGEDRIRVDLRGSTVGATMDVSDPETAQRLNSRVAELQQALEKHGLEAESLRARAVPASETIDVARTVAALRDAEVARATASRSGGEEGGRSGGKPEEELEKEFRNPRHRSRGGQQGEKNT